MYTSLSHCRKDTSDVILVSIKKYYHKVDLGHMYYDSAMEDKDQSMYFMLCSWSKEPDQVTEFINMLGQGCSWDP